MPGLLIQKLSKSLKTKDHLNTLERRLELQDEGKVLELLDKSKTIKERLQSISPMNIEKISSKFKKLMQKGDVNSALRLLTNNISNGILPLPDETWKLLQTKYPMLKLPKQKFVAGSEETSSQ